MNNIFITGATGFLGANLLSVILSDKKNMVFALVRAGGSKDLSRRKKRLINELLPRRLRSAASKRLRVLAGDITKKNLGLCRSDFSRLQEKTNIVYHCAALRDFTRNLSVMREVNVKGTENLLAAALSWKGRSGALRRINHISTAYVSGSYDKIFYEHQLDSGQRFNNSYERSKFEAEKLIQKYRGKGLLIDIYRPSILIDASKVNRFNVSPVVLSFLKAFILNAFQGIKLKDSAAFNLIPVDAASRAIYALSCPESFQPNCAYHIAASRPTPVRTVLRAAGRVFVGRFRAGNAHERIRDIFAPYMVQDHFFDIKKTSVILRRLGIKTLRITEDRLLRLFTEYNSCGRIKNGRK